MDEPRAVREFWFGRLPLTADRLDDRMRFWFADDDDAERRQRRDREMRHRFGGLLERAAAGELANWADGPRRRLSLILLLDQFPRNLFRGTGRAYAYDAQALSLALTGMQLGADAALEVCERLFFYMPLQHAESHEVQDESVAAYRRLLAEAPSPLRSTFQSALRYAQGHQAIIEAFGRFPHRNQLLGRANTAAEEKWLQQSGERFGQ